MDDAGECVRLRKRRGMTLVAGVRVNETVHPSRGGEGKLKDFPARHSLISPACGGGWGARRGGDEKKESSNETSERKTLLLRSHDSSSSGSEGRTFELKQAIIRGSFLSCRWKLSGGGR